MRWKRVKYIEQKMTDPTHLHEHARWLREYALRNTGGIHREALEEAADTKMWADEAESEILRARATPDRRDSPFWRFVLFISSG